MKGLDSRVLDTVDNPRELRVFLDRMAPNLATDALLVHDFFTSSPLTGDQQSVHSSLPGIIASAAEMPESDVAGAALIRDFYEKLLLKKEDDGS